MFNHRLLALAVLAVGCGAPPSTFQFTLLWTFNGQSCAAAGISQVSFVRDGVSQTVPCHADGRDGVVLQFDTPTTLRDLVAVDEEGVSFAGPTSELRLQLSTEAPELAVDFSNEAWRYRVTVESARACEHRSVSIDGSMRFTVPCTGPFEVVLGAGRHDFFFGVGSGCCTAAERAVIRTNGHQQTIDGQYSRYTLEPLHRAF